MNPKKVADEINYDIQMGVYDNFPKLKKRLTDIAQRLLIAHYCSNIELTVSEIRVLQENEYLTN